MRLLAVVAIAVSAATCADLESIKAEPNLEKRAQKALAYADDAFKSAQQSYLAKGDMKLTSSNLDDLAASVQLAYESLAATRKNPSKRPKHFKRAEIKTRELLRRLDDFRDQMSVDDRAAVDKVRSTIQKVHEALLEGIMGGKKGKS